MTANQNKNYKNSTDWIAVLLVYTLCIPEQFSFSIFDIKFFIFRIILIFMIPSILNAYKNQIIMLNFSDIMVGLALGWLIAADLATIGINKAAANGGASIIDVGLSYFFARSRITSPDHARALLIKIGPAFLIAGLTIVIETLSGRYIVQPFASSLTGQASLAIENASSGRLGLLRGTGPFPHPILGGLLIASIFPIFILSKINIKSKIIGLIASFTAMATISSSVLIALGFCGSLVFFEIVREKYQVLSWRGLISFITLNFMGMELFTSGGITGIIVNYLTLDKWTAYYRTLIWKYGLENVYRHPWFGIGLEDWVRPYWMTESIDNYWLYLAISYGVPEALSRISIPIIAAVVAGRSLVWANRSDRRIVLGHIIAVSMMTLMAFTVTFWGVTQVWYFILIGSTVSLAETRRRIYAAVPGPDSN